ncbi:two pore domain potassium channel family protein [Alteromonadaceae bacterium M269]|nr:two pore domain potassium channel family protein [Alteromonadaceae bacterium M269]
MVLLKKLKKFLLRNFVNLRWHTIVLAFFVYCGLSWALLSAAGEEAIVTWPDFMYWMVVTTSTVGYGDLSPTTLSGKYVASLFIIPVGLSIFALVIGRIAAFISFQWRKGVLGLKNLHVSDHILVIGWNQERTINLLNLLLKEREQSVEKADIVLCVRVDIENPMPDKIEFVKVSSFNKDTDMDRACVSEASVIIMDNPEDDLTMTTALYCSKRNPDGHLLAYFNDECLVDLLQSHCPNVECTPSVAVEMLAKSAFDPGSSILHYDLLTLAEGEAQYSVSIPENTNDCSVKSLFDGLKRNYNATLIGCNSGENTRINLNPDWSLVLKPKDKIYYIASSRINNIDWQLFEG